MRRRLKHEPPLFYFSDPQTYFITVCAQMRGQNIFCLPDLGPKILESIQFRHERRTWHCSIAVLMPDHVHLLLSFPDELTMSSAMGDWKRYITTAHGAEWQRNFFDHRIRPGENFGEKMEYVFRNPERAGLIAKAEDWPYIWMEGNWAHDRREFEGSSFNRLHSARCCALRRPAVGGYRTEPVDSSWETESFNFIADGRATTSLLDIG